MVPALPWAGGEGQPHTSCTTWRSLCTCRQNFSRIRLQLPRPRSFRCHPRKRGRGGARNLRSMLPRGARGKCEEEGEDGNRCQADEASAVAEAGSGWPHPSASLRPRESEASLRSPTASSSGGSARSTRASASSANSDRAPFLLCAVDFFPSLHAYRELVVYSFSCLLPG